MGVYNVKIYVKQKKSGFTTSKFTVSQKNWGLQRQNLGLKKTAKKIGVYNVKICVKR